MALERCDEDSLPRNGLRRHGFELTLRGYNREQVDEYVERLRGRLAESNAACESARAELAGLAGLAVQDRRLKPAERDGADALERAALRWEVTAQEADRVLAEARAELAAAQQRATALLAEARAKAVALATAARTTAEEREREAVEVLSRARTQADEILGRGRTDIDDSQVLARAEAERLRSDARDEADRLLRAAHAAAERLVEDARGEAQRAVADGQDELNKIDSERHDLARQRDDIAEQLGLLRSALDALAGPLHTECPQPRTLCEDAYDESTV